MNVTKSWIPDNVEASDVAELFSALGDASRVRIVAALAAQEVCVHILAEIVGLSQSAVSHHLRHLRHMRLVRARKDGRHVFYQLDDEHVNQLFRIAMEHVQHG